MVLTEQEILCKVHNLEENVIHLSSSKMTRGLWDSNNFPHSL